MQSAYNISILNILNSSCSMANICNSYWFFFRAFHFGDALVWLPFLSWTLKIDLKTCHFSFSPFLSSVRRCQEWWIQWKMLQIFNQYLLAFSQPFWLRHSQVMWIFAFVRIHSPHSHATFVSVQFHFTKFIYRFYIVQQQLDVQWNDLISFSIRWGSRKRCPSGKLG